jgi:hypothetical protein
MTTIDRTAYPRFKRALSERDLKEVYTLTEDEITLIDGLATTEQTRLNLAVLLKSCQRLGYFPDIDAIPKRIVFHSHRQLGIPESVLSSMPPLRNLSVSLIYFQRLAHSTALLIAFVHKLIKTIFRM